jgi:small-conductance mechanosensitive channel
MPVWIAFGAVLVIALAIRFILLRAIDRHVRDPLSFGHVFLNAVRFPSVLWCAAIALAVAVRVAAPSEAVMRWAHKGIGAFTILSVSLVFAAVFVRMIAVYGEKKKMPFAVAGLSRTLAYVVVFSIAGLMLLRLFDVTITPILTALGVGGLAVALALQDTLANFFAGVHILVEEPIMVGDFIRLSTGEEGLVRDIGWRTTRIQTFGNNITVVPNTKITSSILTNYSMPDKRVSSEVVIVASHEADADWIAATALAVATQAQGVLPEPAPAVMFDPGVLPTHLQMKLLFHVADRSHRGPVQSAIRTEIYRKFRSAGVPFPTVRV